MKSFIFLLHSPNASRELPCSPRLAHKAPVMQNMIIVFSKSQGAFDVQIVISVCD